MKYQALRPNFFSMGGWLEPLMVGGGSVVAGGWVVVGWWWGGWWRGCLVGLVGSVVRVWGFGVDGKSGSGWVEWWWCCGEWVGWWCVGVGECGVVRWVVVG